jgi:hypothetical protein
MGRASRWWLVVVIVVAGFAGVGAFGLRGLASGDSTSTFELPAVTLDNHPVPPPAGLPSVAPMNSEMAAQMGAMSQQAIATQQQAQTSSGAVAEREDSQTAFQGLSASEAAAVALGHGNAYRFVGRPLIPILHNSLGQPDLQIYFRLNRPLPRTSTGGFRAAVRVQYVNAGSSVFTVGARSGHCFAEELDFRGSTADARRAASRSVGAPVVVALIVSGKSVARVRSRLTVGRVTANGGASAPYVNALGCGK